MPFLIIEKQLEKLEMLACFLAFFLPLLADGKKAFSRGEESSLNPFYHFTSGQGNHFVSWVRGLREMRGVMGKKKKREKQMLPQKEAEMSLPQSPSQKVESLHSQLRFTQISDPRQRVQELRGRLWRQ